MVLRHIFCLFDGALVLSHILEHGRHTTHREDLGLDAVELLLLLLLLLVLQVGYYLVKVLDRRSAGLFDFVLLDHGVHPEQIVHHFAYLVDEEGQ